MKKVSYRDWIENEAEMVVTDILGCAVGLAAAEQKFLGITAEAIADTLMAEISRNLRSRI